MLLRLPRILRTALPILVALVWPRVAAAHDLWIERGGGGFVLHHGHHGGAVLPLAADKVRSLTCRSDKGKVADLRGSADVAPKQLSLKASCVSVSAFLDGGYYALTPDGEKNLPKNQVPDAVKAWRSRQFAKWVDAKSSLAGQPHGDDFEIVPVTDVAKAKAGDKVTFRVLLDGRAIGGAVLAIDHKVLGETDDRGEARVRIRARDVEQVSASYRRPIKSAEADSEVFEASLTFEVAR